MAANSKQSPIPGPSGRAALRWGGRIREAGIVAALVELQKEFGDLVQIKIPLGSHILFVYHPDDVTTILQKEAKSFIKGKAIDPFKLLIGQSLAVTEGATWLAQRRLLQPAFHMRSLEEYGPTMADVTADHRTKILPRDQVHATVDLNTVFSNLTHDIVARALLGAELGPMLDVLRRSWHVALSFIVTRANQLARWPLWAPLPSHFRFRRAMQTVKATVDDIIASESRGVAENRGSPARHNLLRRLLAARASESVQISDQDIRDHALNFLFAGHETTANGLAWAVYLAGQNPDYKQKLCEELDRELQGQPADWNALDRLPYLRAFVYESLRLYPPVSMFVREATSSVALSRGTVLPGQIVVVSPFAMHRREELWPKAEVFDPDRFLGGSAKPNAPAFLAFGAGPRTCIGDHFAIKEMMIVLADFFQNLEIEIEADQNTRPVFNGTLQPHPMRVRLLHRNQGPESLKEIL